MTVVSKIRAQICAFSEQPRLESTLWTSPHLGIKHWRQINAPTPILILEGIKSLSRWRRYLCFDDGFIPPELNSTFCSDNSISPWDLLCLNRLRCFCFFWGGCGWKCLPARVNNAGFVFSGLWRDRGGNGLQDEQNGAKNVMSRWLFVLSLHRVIERPRWSIKFLNKYWYKKQYSTTRFGIDSSEAILSKMDELLWTLKTARSLWNLFKFTTAQKSIFSIACVCL